MDNKKLYVGNLPWSATSDTLREMFAQFGNVVDATVITDRMSGRSKGFGFVTFETEESANQAITAMHEKEIEGRKIVVNTARPKEENRTGGFRPNNGGNRRRPY